MSSRRAFLFAHAGVLLAILLATASSDPGDFDFYVWISFAIALPTAVFRGLVADHRDEHSYRAASGLAGCLTYGATISVFAFTFANRSVTAAWIFTAVSIGCFLLLRFGKRSPS